MQARYVNIFSMDRRKIRRFIGRFGLNEYFAEKDIRNIVAFYVIIPKNYVFNAMGNFDRSMKDREDLLEIARKIRDREKVAIIYSTIGSSYLYSGKIRNALKYLIISQKMARKRRTRSSNCLNIGRTKDILGKLSEALKYYARGIEIAKREGLWEFEFIGYINTAVVYNKKKKMPQEALQSYRKAFKIARYIKDVDTKAALYLNYSILLDALKMHGQAEKYILRSYCILRRVGATKTFGSVLYNLASHYWNREMYSTALRYCNEFMSLRTYNTKRRTAVKQAIVELKQIIRGKK